MSASNAPLVLAAHPDDETIGVGALLAHLPGSVVVHTTDGAPRDERLRLAPPGFSREAYARMRREEVVSALALSGISGDRVLCLAAVDQEAALDLVALTRRVARLLDELQPRMLVTHAYEGGHPDHDATAFIAHAAIALVRRAGGPVPTTLEMTSYHARDGRLTVAEFLTSSEAAGPLARAGEDGVLEHVLSPLEQDLKERMFACFDSQRAVLASFPLTVERVRPAPAYLFARPPHEGPLHYETLRWPMRGERWRELARAAQEELGLASGPL